MVLHNIVIFEKTVNYTKLNDETLIRLMAEPARDANSAAAALGELYDRYGRLVFSIAYNIIGTQLFAEEITLDVFHRVWANARSYRAERGKVSVWLTSMTRYRAIDILRREKSRPERTSISWADVTPHAIPVLQENQPEAMTELSLQKARVRAAIAQLPEAQKRALALAYFGGYTHRQIAEALAEPLGTIKTRIRLAIQKLRQILQEEEPG
jgi:RNA polymerase sigma-70 factor (ECF subfamily)